MFKDYTSNTDKFSKCFTSDGNFDIQFKKWQKVFKKSLYACFRKIRIKNKQNNSKIDLLMNNKRKILKKKNLTESAREEIEKKMILK